MFLRFTYIVNGKYHIRLSLKWFWLVVNFSNTNVLRPIIIRYKSYSYTVSNSNICKSQAAAELTCYLYLYFSILSILRDEFNQLLYKIWYFVTLQVCPYKYKVQKVYSATYNVIKSSHINSNTICSSIRFECSLTQLLTNKNFMFALFLVDICSM